MGILQKILETINNAIDNIDFSPYQLISNKSTSGTLSDNSDTLYPSQKAVKTYVDTGLSLKESLLNKNTSNGYLGLQNHVYFVHVNFFQNGLVYSYPYLFNSIAVSGAGSYTSAGSANTPKLRTGNDTQFRLPTLNLVGSATGNVTCALNGMAAITLKSPYKLLSEQTIAYTDIGTKNNSLVVCIGDGNRALSSFSGTLLFFILNPLQNSGKWRVGKVINGSNLVFANTEVLPVYNNATKFSIYYNKSNETALFYIDDVLVYTMTSVNLPDSTNMVNKMCLVREDSTETISTYACPVQETLIFDLR